MSDLRRYFVVMPVVVQDEPDARRIEFKVRNQMFRFGPDYCENKEHAEWFVDMAIKALQTMIAECSAPETKPVCGSHTGHDETCAQPAEHSGPCV